MITERFERGWRHGVDGVGTDQLLDVEHVAIILVLGSGGGPEQSLRPGALRLELLPARPREQPLVVLIGELGVCDGDLAFERRQSLFFRGIVGASDLFIELLVDRSIDPADEETRDAGDMRGVAAATDVFFETGEVCLCDLQIHLLREQQRDIDADALADQMLDGRQALGRCRHLDHQIRALDLFPEPLGFADAGFGIHGQIRRDFKTDKTVFALQSVVDRAQHIRRVPDVLDSKLLEQVGD